MTNRSKGMSRWISISALGVSCLILAVFMVMGIDSWVSGHLSTDDPKGKGEKPFERSAPNPKLTPLSALADMDLTAACRGNGQVLEVQGTRYIAHYSINPSLQTRASELLQRSMTLKAAAVVVRPGDGRVLAMVSHDKDRTGENLCVKAGFPAASLFKIVSAAAAIEESDFSPDRIVSFQGGKYTLYKRQLTKSPGRGAKTLPFSKAFASSINPVFGKVGIHHVGQRAMNQWAERFLFNQSISFEIPVDRSPVDVPEDPLGLAEIASGFNKRTRISPLHAALLACAVANKGVVMAPWLIESLTTEGGDVVYRAEPTEISSPILEETAKDLRKLMQETVLSGTCRRSFRHLKETKRFEGVEIGAKTGSINDETGQLHIEWVTAYALPPDRSQAICVAVLGAHADRQGLRASEMAQSLIYHYLTQSL